MAFSKMHLSLAQSIPFLNSLLFPHDQFQLFKHTPPLTQDLKKLINPGQETYILEEKNKKEVMKFCSSLCSLYHINF